MTLFPAKTVSRKEGLRAKARDDFEVFCHCRMPELRDISMIECSKCEQWFHCACEDVPQEALDCSSMEWFCKNCIATY